MNCPSLSRKTPLHCTAGDWSGPAPCRVYCRLRRDPGSGPCGRSLQSDTQLCGGGAGGLGTVQFSVQTTEGPLVFSVHNAL